MLSETLLRRSCAGLAGLTVLLCGEATRVQAGACQSYEAAFNQMPYAFPLVNQALYKRTRR